MPTCPNCKSSHCHYEWRGTTRYLVCEICGIRTESEPTEEERRNFNG